MLNALRQSEENHFRTYRDPVYTRRVLNALRQSEENHESFSHLFFIKIIQCSTPYGNQRKITQRFSTKQNSVLVLNALRQSEENHNAEQIAERYPNIVLNALRQSEENHGSKLNRN